MTFAYHSVARVEHREIIEGIAFFNPRQIRAKKGILKAVERFGQPRLQEMECGLTFQVGEHKTQTLFAYDQSDLQKVPLGIIIFLRCSSSALGIVHMAVHPDYAAGGIYEFEELGFRLVDQVRKIGRQINGIERILFFYHGEHGLPL
jgi:hypothetical protein